MNLCQKTAICGWLWLAMLAVGLHSALASGPLYVTGPDANQPGQPYRWNNSSAISYTTDLGNLGNQTNTQADALVADSFASWQNVSTASISFSHAGHLGADITAANVVDFEQNTVNNCLVATTFTNAIVYDVDGSIIEALGDDKNSVLGFAGPACADEATGIYTRGWAVLNGWFIDGSSPPPGTSSHWQLTTDEFRAVFVHEFGHLLGLDHSQINLNCLTDLFCPADDLAGVPIMFPVLVDFKTTPARDDISSLSDLYPGGTYASTTGRIQGQILFSAGATPAQGYNVIARRVGEARITAVSSVSGYLFTPCGDNTLLPDLLRSCASEYWYSTPYYPWGSHDQTLIGVYDIGGLPPGDYTVEVEAINGSGEYAFVGGSGVGPIGSTLSFQYKMPGSCGLQYLHEPASPSDDCSAQSTVPVSAGATRTDTDVILLGTPPRYDAWEDGP